MLVKTVSLNWILWELDTAEHGRQPSPQQQFTPVVQLHTVHVPKATSKYKSDFQEIMVKEI